MNFNDSASEAAFRTEAHDWLAENAPKFSTEGRDLSDESELIELGKGWQACKADAGYACLQWPKEFGGRGATPMEQVVYGEEEAKYDLPGGIFSIGLGMAGPRSCGPWGRA